MRWIHQNAIGCTKRCGGSLLFWLPSCSLSPSQYDVKCTWNLMNSSFVDPAQINLIGSVTIFYETASTLVLRKILVSVIISLPFSFGGRG